jgi:penicillin-binding protein-related factor A (putative recombinase)
MQIIALFFIQFFTNLWSLLLYIQSLLHYIENAQENKKNTILSYNIAENSKRVKRNEEKVCVCVWVGKTCV